MLTEMSSGENRTCAGIEAATKAKSKIVLTYVILAIESVSLQAAACREIIALMSKRKLTALLVLAIASLRGQDALPELKTEATPGGSLFIVRNSSTQPLTAFLIELVNYPGSSYSLWQDDAARQLVAPGAERRIPVVNMTVGAVPDYVKLQAAIFADGSTSGIPAKIEQLVERRRSTLATTRELIRRLEKSGTDKAAVLSDLKSWSESMPPITRANRGSQQAINQGAALDLIRDAAARVESESPSVVLDGLKKAEQSLASSKPAL